ncbi:circadian clock protein KaiC [Nitrospirillum viridazoti Y2]|uniref:non-specific serine/threonine protein kinase n=1 Tax=Nitrospirillum amazonense TaxID=28077 RepID=A0A560J457_9PROT|nr:ATPase domain-containing protein [Nitrospirillum amazonense]EGY01841.1 circadian clock protein KaiC [Nitrospirillum amazonense Y2]TWB63994.1 circadian clock protein KaiC [Nitrospirillum amazonense]
MVETKTLSSRAATGIPGLDDVLAGGLSRRHVFLLEGEPGSGKTTIALQFLLQGAAEGERTLYVTMSETEAELREGAAARGWDLPPSIQILELVPPEALLDADQRQTLIHASELELGESMERLVKEVERVKPDRIALDSLSELRLLAQSSLRYRRQVLTLKHYFAGLGATVLMLDDLTTDTWDRTVHSVAHGVVRLEQLAPAYGAERRRLRVLKYRGTAFRGGFHDFTISAEGVSVFPRLVAIEHKTRFPRDELKSGNPALDQLLGGGVEAGSSTLVIGPAGTGKSLLALTFVAAAVARGEKAAIFAFDEEIGLLFKRMKAFGIDLETLRKRGDVFVEQVDAAELSPGEFSHRVRAAVDERGIKTVVIDSLTGYEAAMPEERALVLHLHEVLLYLNRQGVTTFVTVAQHGLFGSMESPVDITYLADTVILLRYFEADGDIRRAMSVVKKRTGPHETTIREYRIADGGLQLGEPLRNLQGVLRGNPIYTGAKAALFDGNRA